jgi:lipopolysaccharide/colanic/teichoic acid biosynthesis glycosyltransferase
MMPSQARDVVDESWAPESEAASTAPRLQLAPRVAPAGKPAAGVASTVPRLQLVPRTAVAVRSGAVGRYSPLGELVKSLSDRALAALGLVVIAPLLAVIALAVRLDSPGPAFFRQPRVGRNGRMFTFWKFRGMAVDARQRFPELYDYNYSPAEIQALRFHPAEDPRVTRVGQILRRTSLDELPNLINVVLGDMSLVGPRPEIPELLSYYGNAAAEILSVRPGITSLAKLVGRDNITFEETLALDRRYVHGRSLALDFSLLFGTAVMVLTGRSVGH